MTRKFTAWIPLAIASAFAMALIFERQLGLDGDYAAPLWFVAAPGALVVSVFSMNPWGLQAGTVADAFGMFLGLWAFNHLALLGWRKYPLNRMVKVLIYLGGLFICAVLTISILTHFHGSFWQAIGIHTH